MRILISGSHGLIGRALSASLREDGHEVIPLARVRAAGSVDAVAWDPERGLLNVESLEAPDAVIHLAGENIASGRWTATRKAAIRESRVRGTESLVGSLIESGRLPRIFVCASATGYYGDCGSREVDESAGPGEGFPAEVCRAWEEASQPLTEHGVRVAHLRFGVVLSGSGGALAKMLPAFRWGLGGRVGGGRQYMSWVSLEDAARATKFVLQDERAKGPVNVVSPQAVTNAEFTKALGQALRRPTVFPLPAFAARLALGEMADALLLASTRVVPRRLAELGYAFRHPEINGALRAVLGER